jgi:oxaloacetate decarboxylase alpha subunit
MESQLKEQGAIDRMDEVLEEIPRVREDLGFIPLVTPTSQIVGTQAVINVMQGERYKSISKETQGVLKGEYGATPAPVNKELQAKVLAPGEKAITCRPADLIAPEYESLVKELKNIAATKNISLASGDKEADDVLTYALFNQVGLKFLENRNNPSMFEPILTGKEGDVVKNGKGEEIYTVGLEGKSYTVTVNNGGDITGIVQIGGSAVSDGAIPKATGKPVKAPLAGVIFRVLVSPGQSVVEGEKLLILEAMKMETEICAPHSGVIGAVNIESGDSVTVGDILMTIA